MVSRDERPGDAAGVLREEGFEANRGAALRAFIAIAVGALLGIPLAMFALRDLHGLARVGVFTLAVLLGGFVGGYLTRDQS